MSVVTYKMQEDVCISIILWNGIYKNDLLLDSLGRPTVMTGSDHYFLTCRLSVRSP